MLACSVAFFCRNRLLILGIVATLDPQEDGHDGEVGGQKHRAGQIGSDAHKPLLLHEEIEKEALVQVLEQIVQTPERAFDQPAHGHLVMPTLAVRLQRDGVDMIGYKAAVGPRGMSEALLEHAS